MSNQSQYGFPRFVADLQVDDSVKMERVHFVKSDANSPAYNEGWVQRLIMNQPDLLPVDEVEPAFADLVPICMELPTASGGFLDNLFITPSGNIALVECKLWRNPEARRAVVGQIIEYAKDLSRWTYEDLQRAISLAKKRDQPHGETPETLYQTISRFGDVDEVTFHDAVSRNLRRGRFLLMIVGDGIREGVERMTEFLQQHAGLHFVLGIVELALFRVPTGGYIAQPRILARTENIVRGIVTVDGDGQVSIKRAGDPLKLAESPATKMTLTKELFLEKLEKRFVGVTERLNSFSEKLSGSGVRPDFGKDSMTLRWSPDGSRPWNLGSIASGGNVGQLWMDFVGRRAQKEGLVTPYKQFLADIADVVPGAYVRQTPKVSGWYVADEKDRMIGVDALLSDEQREDKWINAIERFQEAAAKSTEID